jgi:GTP pyrophosphokinase
LRDYRLVGEALWSRFNAGKEDQFWYQRALSEAFREAGLAPRPLVDELEFTVSELEGLARQA